MRKIYTIVAVAFVALTMTACKGTPESTIVNLKAAIDGESTASAKYAVFATKAQEEGHFEIAALFQATSIAEDIHAKNHNAVLVGLGQPEYVAVVAEITSDSTLMNLQAAIDGETYEFETMYPEFLAAAEKESVMPATVSYNYALDTEKGHATLYAAAVANIANPTAIATVYHVCPVCGNTFAGDAPEACELCQTGSDKFLVSSAQAREVVAETAL